MTTQDIDAKAQAARQQYFHYLCEQCNDITLEGLPSDQNVGPRRFQLEDLFIPLRLQKIADSDPEKMLYKAEPIQPVSAVLAQHSRLAILSGPGGGKSTLIKRLTMAYAFPQSNRAFDDDLPTREWLPVLIRCRRLGALVTQPFENILDAIVEKADLDALTETFNHLLEHALTQGDALILIDGLDEIANAHDRMAFVAELHRFFAVYSNAHVIVTSREPGFRVVGGAMNEICQSFRIMDFNKNDITRLTVAWHKVVVGDRPEVLADAEDLAQTITQSDRILQLAKNPLLLTTLLLVKRWVGQLPTRRSVLYGKAIEVLLMTWNVEGFEPVDPGEAIPQLAYVAFSMMQAGEQRISATDLEKTLREARTQMPEELGYAKLSVDQFIDRIESRSSLLILTGFEALNGKTIPIYEFQHLTFQEYLTAVAIVNGYYPNRQDEDDLLTTLEPHLGDEFWKEVVPLAAVLSGRKSHIIVERLIALSKSTTSDVLSKYQNALYSCIVDEVQAPPTLLIHALQEIAATEWFADVEEKTLALSRTKYGAQFLDVMTKIYMALEGNLIRLGGKIAIIQWSRLGVTEVLTDESYRKIRQMLTSKETVQQVYGLLLVMQLAFLKGSNCNITNMKQLGNEIIPFVMSDQVTLHFASCWAFAWLGKSIDPLNTPKLIPRFLALWRQSPSQEVQHVASWAITTIPMRNRALDLDKAPGLCDFLMENIKKDKARHSWLASWIIGFYLKQPWTDAQLASLLTKPFFQYESDFDYQHFLKALGPPGEAQLAKLNQQDEPDVKDEPAQDATSITHIRIKTLTLDNIGLFKHQAFHFDDHCAVIIGLNGTGKTTLLRALALGLIGDQTGIDSHITENLLRIKGRKDTTREYSAQGQIQVVVEVDGQTHENTVKLTQNHQDGTIELEQTPFEAVFDGLYLKSLIIGFNQQRGISPKQAKKNPPIAIDRPKIADLLGLINQQDSGMMHAFSSWIANLDIEIRNGDSNKQAVLDKAFQIFSEISGNNIAFDAVTHIEPLELWIKTQDFPHGIPIHMASLGYQSIMSWVGYFMERLYEANQRSPRFNEASAIVLVDELDLFLHPAWQDKVLGVLRKHFPNTQFIVSTHSPLVIQGLDFKQVNQLLFENGELVVKQNDVDIWVWSYQDLLNRWFQTRQDFPKVAEKILSQIRELQTIEQPTAPEQNKLDQLKSTYERLQASSAAIDETDAIRQRLKRKEQDLDHMLAQYAKD